MRDGLAREARPLAGERRLRRLAKAFDGQQVDQRLVVEVGATEDGADAWHPGRRPRVDTLHVRVGVG